jgi:hypothetical protein
MDVLSFSKAKMERLAPGVLGNDFLISLDFSTLSDLVLLSCPPIIVALFGLPRARQPASVLSCLL